MDSTTGESTLSLGMLSCGDPAPSRAAVLLTVSANRRAWNGALTVGKNTTIGVS